MPNGKKTVIIVVIAILLLLGASTLAMWLLRPQASSDMSVPDIDMTSSSLSEDHWNANDQITQIGQPYSTEPSRSEPDANSNRAPSLGPEYSAYEAYRRDGGSGVMTSDLDSALKPEQQSEPDPRTSSVVQGKVAYDDIQNASVIEGGYSSDDIRTEVVRYLEKTYPTEMIASIELLGNGSEKSQDTGTPTSYVDYLITLSKGQRIGLSVTCSTEYSPAVQETNYLLVSPTLLYNVEENEYIPISITETERIPADTIIDH